MRRLAARFDSRRLLDQHRRGRGLDDEAEALVLVRGDHHRQHQARLDLLGLGVERLAEFHDVEAALAERRPDRRARVCLARGHLKLDESDDFLRHFALLSTGPNEIRLESLPGCYAFSTCPNSSSTGVARPKIVTDTRSFDLS